ncbi:hypothetical protein PR202_gb27522 [Eleusine coracana subsp. coracana]|uniref:TF-B3 domain-containing protein n=1 Tax=Eleusine coracana subsp. coracana TaxID=191504 RepID=A0AAV5FUE2_ELECO|nr:hypothetical protein PR202_gb27522 [Eleusine coracana subsp. coracana]
MITLQDSMDSTRFWQVQGYRYNNGNCQLGSGWKSFCRDIKLKEGDIVTINVIQTTLWRVDITRCGENINQTYHEIPSGSQGEKRPNGSMACLSNSRTQCVFEIGPPTWIRKEINKSTIEDHLFLPAAFCDAIGLQKICLVTLKSSLYGTRSWHVCVSPRKNSSSHCVTSGWKRFCQENDLKGNQGATARKDLRVLLPFTSDSPRIPDELAADELAAEALVVGPYGDDVKVWHVEVRRDGNGALLGRGCCRVRGRHGVVLILRHRGRGALTVKAFDSNYCLRELGAPAPPADEATTTSREAASKPQFITMLPQDFMKKMLIPAKFVQLYIPREHLNSTAIIFGPVGKIFQIELEMNRSEVFFASGWPQFISFHGITGANALLLRYEGGMVFTVKVFEPNGCLRGPKHKGIRLQQSEQNSLRYI